MEYEFQVKKEDISFKVCLYSDGCFNNANAPNYSFKDAESYFLMLYKNIGYIPQYGDTLWCDTERTATEENRFIIVSKDFAVDDYSTIILCVVHEDDYYKRWQ